MRHLIESVFQAFAEEIENRQYSLSILQAFCQSSAFGFLAFALATTPRMAMRVMSCLGAVGATKILFIKTSCPIANTPNLLVARVN